jgi:hypothetical protein
VATSEPVVFTTGEREAVTVATTGGRLLQRLVGRRLAEDSRTATKTMPNARRRPESSVRVGIIVRWHMIVDGSMNGSERVNEMLSAMAL